MKLLLELIIILLLLLVLDPVTSIWLNFVALLQPEIESNTFVRLPN